MHHNKNYSGEYTNLEALHSLNVQPPQHHDRRSEIVAMLIALGPAAAIALLAIALILL